MTVKAAAGAEFARSSPTMIAHKDPMSALQKKFPDVSAFTVSTEGTRRHPQARLQARLRHSRRRARR